MPYFEVILDDDFQWIFRISADEQEIAEYGEDILKQYPQYLEKILRSINIKSVEIPSPEAFKSSLEFHVNAETIKAIQQKLNVNVSQTQKIKWWE